ncbi:MAG: PHP domain-containing protein [Lapillicoccus sp.]
MTRIDLHTHSTASDGTEAPADVVASARRAGLDVVALTDHDTAHGWDEAAEAASRLGVALVRGIEISCSRYGRSIHLLGYLVDPGHSGLAAEIGHAREARVSRLRRMVGRMVADGIPITYAQVLAQVPTGATEGRPHIADALVANGTVSNRDEAFVRWLGNDSPYYVRHYAPDPVDAVRLVVEAGGVAVHAHPFGRGRGAGAGDAVIEEMAAAGLSGLEVDHRDHDEAARAHGRELADRLGLLVTGSSDYHGGGKANRLGENTTASEVLAEIEARSSGAVPVLR